MYNLYQFVAADGPVHGRRFLVYAMDQDEAEERLAKQYGEDQGWRLEAILGRVDNHIFLPV